MKNDSTAISLFNLKDKDGEDDGVIKNQLVIDTAENGYILSVINETELTQQWVYIFDLLGADGPQELIQDIIDHLGLNDKVKLQK